MNVGHRAGISKTPAASTLEQKLKGDAAAAPAAAVKAAKRTIALRFQTGGMRSIE